MQKKSETMSALERYEHHMQLALAALQEISPHMARADRQLFDFDMKCFKSKEKS